MDIPVTFEFEGKEYHGSFHEVMGAGRDHWHLMVNNYYWGRLRRVGDTWFFDGAKFLPDDSLINYFAAVIMDWYQ